MLFNSEIYIFIFLPITFFVYFFLSRFFSEKVRNLWLVFSSLFFYGFWNPIYIPLLLFSIVFNFFVGKILSHKNELFHFVYWRKTILIIGITINLSLLGFFKYADFIIKNINWLFDRNILLLHIVLPLAISFFTFQQVAYLVDSYKGFTYEYDFINYSVFVTFFPQLIAGPIVHHKEMLPQFSDEKNNILNLKNISLGIFIFLVGLVKKVSIADTFAIWANAGYAYKGVLTFYDAWGTSLAYTFQLYFDFSGYTDMAIGSALLFNIKLPINFNSPYKSLNIQDFWHRWHMTLSRFLKDYIYIPLGGNRKGEIRMYLAISAVFILGGLWHGASWTFVVWGALHGIATIVHRLWSKYSNIRLSKMVAWFITFNFINITWIFFRAETFEKAYQVLWSMFNFSNISIVTKLFSEEQWLMVRTGSFLGEVGSRAISIWIILFLFIVIYTNNSNELQLKFKTTILYLIITVLLYILGISGMNAFSEFLYFNF